ncbi:MAG: transcriptional repressor LexA [Pseudomonadota bacterium]
MGHQDRSATRLTPRQRAVLDCIRDALQRDGRPPTLREIGVEVGIRSTNGVSDHLKALEAKGYIDRTTGRSRGLRITEPGGGHATPPVTRRIPLLGRIAAGLPILADENVEREINVTDDFPGLASHRDLFALRVSGESMIGDGIFDGDLIFVTPTSIAAPGSIVVALIDDEATVKRYYPENGRIRLEASNPQMGPIHVTPEEGRTAVIQGIVVGVYRKF